jgi:hypothetical protein
VEVRKKLLALVIGHYFRISPKSLSTTPRTLVCVAGVRCALLRQRQEKKGKDKGRDKDKDE